MALAATLDYNSSIMTKRIIFYIVLTASVFIAGTNFADYTEMETGTLNTIDNQRIAYERHIKPSDKVIIVCPGFYNSKENRWMKKTVKLLYQKYDVIIFDFRGHGSSSGEYTWSAKEDLDVNAVIDYAGTKGYKKIGVLAFSLGAASAVNAAAKRDDIDSLILISCPWRFSAINFHFWEPEMLSDLIDNISCKWEGKGAKTTHVFMKKTDPAKSIGSLKDTPVLLIHGDKDWVIKSEHAKKLYAALRGPKKLIIMENGLHAERLIEKHPQKMEKIILEWFEKTLR